MTGPSPEPRGWAATLGALPSHSWTLLLSTAPPRRPTCRHRGGRGCEDCQRVNVSLRGSAFAVVHSTPSNIGLAMITVSSMGRATSVTELTLEWMDPAPRPENFWYGPLNRLDFGFTQDIGSGRRRSWGSIGPGLPNLRPSYPTATQRSSLSRSTAVIPSGHGGACAILGAALASHGC